MVGTGQLALFNSFLLVLLARNVLGKIRESFPTPFSSIPRAVSCFHVFFLSVVASGCLLLPLVCSCRLLLVITFCFFLSFLPSLDYQGKARMT